MTKRLADIAHIQFGYYDTPVEAGELHYLQAKHFDESGAFTRFDDSFIIADDKSRKHVLQPGDVLLVGKGFRLFAWQYEGTPAPAVASTLFFVISAKDQAALVPEYLTTFLNLPKTQLYLRQLGAGTSIPSIRKNELSDLSIPLPDLATQQMVARLQALHQQEISLLNALIGEKQTLVENLINQLIHVTPEKDS